MTSILRLPWRRLGALGLAIGAILGALIVVAARALADSVGAASSLDPVAVGSAALALAGAAVALWARWRASRAEARKADADANLAEMRSAVEMVRLMRAELATTMTELAAARAGVRAADQRSDRQDEEITRLRATLEAMRAGDVDTVDIVPPAPYRSSLGPTGPMPTVTAWDTE